MAVAGVHRRVPVGDETLGQRGVEFGLGLLHPLAHRLDAHALGQTREGVFTAHAVQVHDGGQGGVVGEPADVAEAFAFDEGAEGEAVEDFAHGGGVGAGAGDGAALRKAFDDPEVFEEGTPGDEAAIGGEGGVGASEGEFARERVEGEVVRTGDLLFTCQVKGNQRGRKAHGP